MPPVPRAPYKQGWSGRKCVCARGMGGGHLQPPVHFHALPLCRHGGSHLHLPCLDVQWLQHHAPSLLVAVLLCSSCDSIPPHAPAGPLSLDHGAERLHTSKGELLQGADLPKQRRKVNAGCLPKGTALPGAVEVRQPQQQRPVLCLHQCQQVYVSRQLRTLAEQWRAERPLGCSRLKGLLGFQEVGTPLPSPVLALLHQEPLSKDDNRGIIGLQLEGAAGTRRFF
mmetsp:Transcript_5576/g.15589  ORF Transcript_5576/g.15589 Transcript_5576/m.15589 type:complete len:225 (-) Transcript_5576:2840-3514(-)